jgi:hypothetical protein
METLQTWIAMVTVKMMENTEHMLKPYCEGKLINCWMLRYPTIYFKSNQIVSFERF